MLDVVLALMMRILKPTLLEIAFVAARILQDDDDNYSSSGFIAMITSKLQDLDA